MKFHQFVTITLFSFALAWSGDKPPESERIKKSLNECIEKGQTTMVQVECYGTYEDSLNKALNKVYQSTMAKLKPDLKKKMKETQLAWLQFRDKENSTAMSIYALMRGSIRHQYAAGKFYSLTEQRLKELEAYLDILTEEIE